MDPYYLTHKAQQLGYHPEVVLAGRRINDNMGFYVAAQVVKRMARKDIAVAGSRILVMGLAFKENCPDVRNTRVVCCRLKHSSVAKSGGTRTMGHAVSYRWTNVNPHYTLRT